MEMRHLPPARVVECLLEDQKRRKQQGQSVLAEEYFQVPDVLAADDPSAFSLVFGEYLLRQENGEDPAVAKYLNRFPQFADQMVEEVAALQCRTASQRGLNSVAGPGQIPNQTHNAAGSLSNHAGISPSTMQVSWPVADGYTIVGEIGRGGMGVVYKAIQHGLERTVALKMILGCQWLSPTHLDSFRAEIESVAKRQHPNIVQVYDIGEGDGLPFFSLEFVEGGSLASRLDRMPQSPFATAEFVACVASAMHYAHLRGVVHLDLKPANILLADRGSICTENDGKEHWLHRVTPKIADFGLAKRLDMASSWKRADDVMGTPNYMAPEQVAGRVKDVGPAADVYALAAILYELLTGRPPYLGETPMDTVLLVLEAQLVPPSKLQPTIPGDLETICIKCLKPEPRSRYASAEALADDLQRFIEEKPILARRTSVAEQTWKWTHRHPAIAALTTLTFAAVVTLASVLWWRKHEDELDLVSRRKDGLKALIDGRSYLAYHDTTLARVELTRGLARLDSDPRLAEMATLLGHELQNAERQDTEEKAERQVRQRLEIFLVLKDQSLLHLAHFAGIDSQTELAAARTTVEEALVLSSSREGTPPTPLLREPRLSSSEGIETVRSSDRGTGRHDSIEA